MIRIDFEGDPIINTLSKLEREKLPRIMVRTLNRVSDMARVRARREISQNIRLPQRTVNRYIKSNPAHLGKLDAEFKAYGKRTPIHELSPRQVPSGRNLGNKRRKGGGVRYKGEGGKTGFIPGAFIQAIRVKDVPGVYTRMGKGRHPVWFHRGVSIPYVFVQEAIEDAMHETTSDNLSKVFRQNLAYYLKDKALNLR